LLDRAAVDAVIERHRPAAVLHFAALTVIPESVAKPLLYLSQIVAGSLNLLDRMMSHGVRRLVFSSTAGLFSSAASAEPIEEDHPIMPGSPYGEAKFIVERMLLSSPLGSGTASTPMDTTTRHRCSGRPPWRSGRAAVCSDFCAARNGTEVVAYSPLVPPFAIES
jgi:hypothetical protein